jgi:hypothetical protein
VRSAAAQALFLEGSICALVNLGIGDKGKGRTIRIQIRDQRRAEVNKKDEDGAREYQSAGEAHRTTMVEGEGRRCFRLRLCSLPKYLGKIFL